MGLATTRAMMTATAPMFGSNSAQPLTALSTWACNDISFNFDLFEGLGGGRSGDPHASYRIAAGARSLTVKLFLMRATIVLSMRISGEYFRW